MNVRFDFCSTDARKLTRLAKCGITIFVYLVVATGYRKEIYK